MRWLLQFTVRQDEAKQNRKLPEIAFFDPDGNPFNFSQAPVDLTPYARLDGADFTGPLEVGGAAVATEEYVATSQPNLAPYARLDGAHFSGNVQVDGSLTDAAGDLFLTQALQETFIDAKGDLIVGSGPDAAIRKAVGTNGQVLTADSGSSDGMKWSDRLLVKTLSQLTNALAIANPDVFAFATDDNGGTVYHSDGATWTKLSPGVSENPRGRLNSIKNTTAPGTVALGANAIGDLAGLNLQFTYNGRNVVSRFSAPFKFSVASISLQVKLTDVGSGKQVFTDMNITPNVANLTWQIRLDSGPINALADGTPLVVGQQYTWKLSVQPVSAGSYQMPVAANTEYFAHHEIIEV